MRWWESRLIHEPTASADAAIVQRSSRRRSHGSPGAVSATVGDRYTTTTSAEVVGSWTRRLSHHRMVPCELWDAQTPARRLNRRVSSLRCEVEQVCKCSAVVSQMLQASGRSLDEIERCLSKVAHGWSRPTSSPLGAAPSSPGRRERLRREHLYPGRRVRL